MAAIQDHLHILELAVNNLLPEKIDSQSHPPLTIVRDLLDAGYLTAIDVSSFDGEAYLSPHITLAGREYIWKHQHEQPDAINGLIATLDRIRDIMVAVSTGGPTIDDLNPEYRQLYEAANTELKKLGIPHGNSFEDLWDWYGRWSSGDLPTYRSRREYLSGLFRPLMKQVRNHASNHSVRSPEPTGWVRVDRTVYEIRRRLAEAVTEEQFQSVGLLCREVLISVAQSVYDPEIHSTVDGKQPSETDAKRLLEAFLTMELAGSSHEAARRHARTAYELAVELQHRRTATFQQAALCVEATTSVINVIAIVSGRRNPSNA